jgi:hypothetical protein
LPASCNSPNCTEIECAPIDMSISRSLVDNSDLVRKWDTAGPKRVLCNLWGCAVQHSQDSDKLMRCQRCKEVLYCSVAHQVNLSAYSLAGLLMAFTIASRLERPQKCLREKTLNVH